MRFKPSVVLGALAVGSALYGAPSMTVSTRDYAAGAVVVEWAQYTLSTSGNVNVKSGANVSFSAGSSITLYPGFKVEAGGVFNATVAYNPPYNPGGYYNGITPTLALVGGDQQYGQVGQFNRLPLDIAIRNTAGTAPLVNAPVLVTVSSGGGWLSTTNDAGAVLVQTLQLTTDANGTVHVYFKQGDTASVTSKIQIIAGGQTWEFTTISYSSAGPGVISDTDGDLIPDTTEIALGMNAEQATRLTNTSAFGLMILLP